MTNEEIFNSMISFIENHSVDGIIKNKDGRMGTLVFDKGDVYILCEGEKIMYDMDTLLSKIIDDGWIFE